MHIIKRYALVILAVELVAAAVLIVGLLVPLPGHVELKIVQSGSMEPSVPVGSLVTIVPAAHYAAGDIITFGDDSKRRIPTTHRIVATERVGGSLHFRTKGDANEEADNALVPHSAVVGKVMLTMPRLGYVLDFARSRNGFFFMVVIPAALIILDELISLAQSIRAVRNRQGAPQPVRRRHVPEFPPALMPHRAGIDGYSVILRPL